MTRDEIDEIVYKWARANCGDSHIFSIVFDDDFVEDNSIAITINGTTLTTNFETSSNHTIRLMGRAIQDLDDIHLAYRSADRTLTIHSILGIDNLTVDSIAVTGGVTQPDYDISLIQTSKKIDVVWSNQAYVRPDDDYVALNIITIDANDYPEEELPEIESGIRDCKVYYTVYCRVLFSSLVTKSGIDRIVQLRNSLLNETQKKRYWGNYLLGIGSVDKITDITEMLESEYNEKRFFDFNFFYTDSFKEYVNIVESASHERDE